MNDRKTYCNPLPLPSYQRGRLSHRKSDPKCMGWVNEVRCDFREMADPTVIRFQNKWYLFPSAGMCWVSDDLVEWTHHPVSPFDPGYAPTVAQFGDWLYLTACSDRMWRAKHPLGPWEDLGNVLDETGKPVYWPDPMLFVDDGVMYCYHGLGKDGIYVVRLRQDKPNQFAEPRRHCFAFDPQHVWERRGEFNQDPTISYIEGAWMTKHAGKFYLQYSGPGTEWRNYGLGCYVGETPLGPWRYQQRNPICVAPRGNGVVNGCGHHSVVEGPNGTLWCFYTTLVRIEHWFERRIGMDPVGFDERGEMFVLPPSERPQWAPGVIADPARGNDAGLLPISVNQPVRASSSSPGHEPVYAVDDQIRTWWQAADAATPAWITIDLAETFDVSAARILFADRGLDYDAGVLPGAYQYQIQASADGQTWQTLCDRSSNTVDRHIAYDTFAARPARHVRLLFTGVPKGLTPAVWEFTVFGRFAGTA